MNAKRGFTLMEMVVGLIMLAIALVMLASVIFPQAQRSAQNISQARAAQLSEMVMAELMARSFDRNTPNGGGAVSSLNCTKVSTGTDPKQWQFFEDFNGFNGDANDWLGANFDRYRIAIQVDCYSSSIGSIAWSQGSKRALVTITAPQGSRFEFELMRGNY